MRSGLRSEDETPLTKDALERVSMRSPQQPRLFPFPLTLHHHHDTYPSEAHLVA